MIKLIVNFRSPSSNWSLFMAVNISPPMVCNTDVDRFLCLVNICSIFHLVFVLTCLP